MKKISEHLGQIIIALAGIVLLIGAITLFKAPIGDFFDNIIEKETAVGQKVLDSMKIERQYTIIKGAGQTYSTGTLSFTSDAPFSKFAGVKVNNAIVDPVNYKVEEGSTIITFTEEYSKVLANGDYTIEVLATDGAASAPFDVKINGDVDVEVEPDWVEMNWTGLTSFSGSYIWSDGSNIYFSDDDEQYVLNGDTWEVMTWNKPSRLELCGNNIWTDGTKIYHSDYSDNYVLNTATNTWEQLWLDGFYSVSGLSVWSDGSNTYYSFGDNQYKWTGSKWVEMEWGGLTEFEGAGVWQYDGDIYYSYYEDHYVLNGTTWEPMTWDGLTSFNGDSIWSDSVNIYYSSGSNQYVLNGTTWEPKTWNGLTSFSGFRVWSDGNNVYYSQNKNQYVNVK